MLRTRKDVAVVVATYTHLFQVEVADHLVNVFVPHDRIQEVGDALRPQLATGVLLNVRPLTESTPRVLGTD